MNAITNTEKTAAKAVEIETHNEWHEARVAFEAVRDAWTVLDNEEKRLRALVEAECPIPDALRDKVCGGHFSSAWHIEQARGLSFQQKVDLLPILSDWNARRAEAKERVGLVEHNDNGDDPVDQAHDVYFDAALRLIALPAPDVAALAYQLRTTINVGHLDFIGEDADEAATISRLLTEPALDGGRCVAQAYRSALRLAGIQTAALDAEPFLADGWIEAFESRHVGVQIDSRGPVYIEKADGTLPPHEEARADWNSLWVWQKDLVKKAGNRIGEEANAWLNDFEDAGGNAMIGPDGVVYLGGPLDADERSETRAALLTALDDEPPLRQRVIAKAQVHFAAVNLRNTAMDNARKAVA